MAEADFLQIIRRILDWSFTEEDKLRIVSVIKEVVFELNLLSFLENYYQERGEDLFESIFSDFCLKVRAKESLFKGKTKINKAYLKTMVKNAIVDLLSKAAGDALMRPNYLESYAVEESEEDDLGQDYVFVENPEPIDYLRVERALAFIAGWSDKKKEVLCKKLREIYEGVEKGKGEKKSDAFYQMWKRIRDELKSFFDKSGATVEELDYWAIRVLSEICNRNRLNK
ncbi:MAG: hypothetical protein ABIM45_06545 [candidate division WOR-3 bacterium]